MKPRILTAVALLFAFNVGWAQHPRLFLDATRITELQTAIAVPGSHHKEVYDAIKARVDQNDWLVYDENTSDGNWNYARSWLAREAALMYLLTNNATYAQYAYDALYDVHNDIDPDGRIPESGYGLRRAAIGVGFAIAYDWCYNAWSTTQRDYIYDKIDQTLDNWPSYNHANLNASHRGSNWVGVCRGGELITMLAVYEETNRASRYADLKSWLNTHMSTAYGDEGWMQEGNGYMGYTSGFLFPAILAARHIGDTDFDTEFGQHTWWKLPAYYGSFTDDQYVLQWGVGGNYLDPEGGTSALLGLIPSADLPYYQYFYDRFRGQQNAAAAGDKFDHKRGGSIWSLIYYDENSTALDINGFLPTGIEDAYKGAMYFRNRWQDEDDILVSIMGDNHYHGNSWDQKEATQIQLFAYDTRFFGGPDKDRDTQFFSTFQVDGADGYNDHNGQRGLTGGVDAFEINGDYGYAIVDGGTKYAEIGMTSVKRHLMVDFSEEAAPALLSTLDIAEDGSNHDYEWHINLGESSDAVGLPTSTGTESGVPYFVVSGNNSSYVKGWVLSPASAYISEDDLRLRVRVDNVTNTNIWVVMTVGTGTPPVGAVAGSGMSSTLTVNTVDVSYNATDNRILASSAGGNFLPSISIDNPSNGATFAHGSDITIDATASDSDGSIAKVEFFEGSNKLGEDTSSPYSFTWNSVAAGSYVLTAVATDDDNGATTSAVVGIDVSGPNTSPTISITAPGDNAAFIAGDDVTISATANDSDGTIAKVEFYEGSNKLGEDTSSPYSFTWTSAPASSYALTAVATDDDAAMTTSSAINITVNAGNAPPIVSLTAPVDNSTFDDGDDITITAIASDSDGSIAKVEFYEGSNKLGEDNSSPYSYTWTNVSGGTYSLTAVAIDDEGGSTTSSAITISEDISFYAGHCKRKLITIDNSRVSGTSNLTDFPLYFSTTDNDLRTEANGGFVESAQGWDIVFTADDGVTE
ncbi:MAG: Ig-like domain-containing protein, partial [Bacteroidota bacterium]